MELQERWLLISPYHTLGYLQQEIFGLVPENQHKIGPWITSAALTVLGFGTAHWRVSRTLKV
jgi:hypothetical protein